MRYGHLRRTHCLLLIFDVRAQTYVSALIKGAANRIAISHHSPSGSNGLHVDAWGLTYGQHSPDPRSIQTERFWRSILPTSLKRNSITKKPLDIFSFSHFPTCSTLFSAAQCTFVQFSCAESAESGCQTRFRRALITAVNNKYTRSVPKLARSLWM